MFFKRYCCLFFCFLPLFALAQSPDSAGIKTQHLQPVSVTAGKPTYFSPGSRTVALDSVALRTHTAGSLADVLQSRTPLFLKNYGQGQLASISFRGTSARHTALLWNGLNINFATLGEADFSLIPVNASNSITVQHGSASSSYGTGAIGGAILLENTLQFKPGYQLFLQQDFGSFGRRHSSLGGNYSNGKISVNTTLFQQQTDNDFKFANTAKFGAPTEQLQNAASQQKGFTQDIGVKLNNRSTLAFKSWFTHADRQIQANMVTAHNNAREKDQSLRLLGEYAVQTGIGKSVVKAAFFEDIINYSNNTTRAGSNVKTYQTVAEHQVIFTEKLTLKAGADLQYFNADVVSYNRHVTEKRASVFGLLRYDLSEKLSLSLNVRQAFVQQFDPPLTPAFGLHYALLQDSVFTLAAKGNIARSYRVPTLNERFWPTGDASIKPENGLSYEAGLEAKISKSQHRLTSEITAYQMQVKNWIQWVPGRSGQDWSPKNLAEVQASGIELSARYSYAGQAIKPTVGAGYTYTRSIQKESFNTEEKGRQLLYVPLHSATVFTDVIYKNWLLSANGSYTGLRYTTNTNDVSLPAYFLANAHAGYTFKKSRYQLQLSASVYNITNAVYHPIAWQAMPPRNYGISVRFLINN